MKTIQTAMKVGSVLAEEPGDIQENPTMPKKSKKPKKDKAKLKKKEDEKFMEGVNRRNREAYSNYTGSR